MAGEAARADVALATPPVSPVSSDAVAGWRSRLTRALPALAPAAAGIVAFGLIAPTVLRTVASWDTAEFQTVGPVLGTAHPTGFPSYVVLGWLASIVLQPFGEPAYRMDLLQAILAAVAVGGMVWIVEELGASRPIAFASGLLLATSLLFWRLGTHADPHMFHVALLAVLFGLLVGWERRRRSAEPGRAGSADRWLVAATFVYGTAVANHSLALLLAPGIGLYVLAVEPAIVLRPRLIAICALVMAATAAAFFLELPVRTLMHAPLVYAKPDTWQGFWYVVLAEQFTSSLVAPWSDLAAKAIHVRDILAVDLGVSSYLFLAGYLAAVVRRPLAGLVAGGLALLAVWLVSPAFFDTAPPGAPLAAYGLPLGLAAVAVLRPRYGLLSGVSVVITLWFAASYVNADIERYYLGPVLIGYTWAGVCAAEAIGVLAGLVGGRQERTGSTGPAGLVALFTEPGALRKRLESSVVAETGPTRTATRRPAAAASAAAPDAGEQRPPAEGPLPAARRRAAVVSIGGLGLAALLAATALNVAPDRYRDTRFAGGANESSHHGDATWLNEVMAGLPREAALISWWSRSTTLWYGQRVLGLRPDLVIADDRTRIDIGIGQDVPTGIAFYQGQGRPVFLIRYSSDEIARLGERYQLRPWFGASMYQVIGPKDSSQ